MEIGHLKWDSGFFGFQVGKIESRPNNQAIDVSALKRSAVQSGYKLIYIITDQSDPISKKLSTELVDVQVSLEMKIPSKLDYREYSIVTIENLSEFTTVDKLFQISDDISVYSRFYKDPRIDKAKVILLYRAFIENSLNRSLGDGLLLKLYKNGDVCGLFIPQSHEDTGTEVLVGVNKKYRKKGIGKELFKCSLSYWRDKGIRKIRTKVSKYNEDSLKFHQRLGYNVTDIRNIYHLWL